MSPRSPFAERFRRNLAALGLQGPDSHVLVATSGGCDSVSLLHLLRFAAGLGPPHLSAAHFDHAMRPDSAADARWVAGLCRAWEVPLLYARASSRLRSEDEARRARYRFLRSASAEVGATHLATAHHADDQAETVLFRILRGTGLSGVAGIAPITSTGLVRPLLPFWRSEIEGYARSVGLRWRSDPTNRSVRLARNWVRHVLLPKIELQLAPAARRNLVRLARLAAEAEAGWEALLEPLAEQCARVENGAILLARQPFRAYHPALRSRLVRRLLRRYGLTPTEAGTRMAVQFIIDAPSGKELQLPAGLRLHAEFDQVRIGLRQDAAADEILWIAAGAGSGSGELRLQDRRYRLRWVVTETAPEWWRAEDEWNAAIAPTAAVFPLGVRSWSPGDRIRLAAGSRRLKKLFGDRRVPRSERARIPVLFDASGVVLWVAGVVQSPASRPRPGQNALFITVFHG